jgi:hypothetical protein
VGEISVQRLIEMSDAGTSTFDTILLPPRVLSGATCPVPAHLQSPTVAGERCGSRNGSNSAKASH